MQALESEQESGATPTRRGGRRDAALRRVDVEWAALMTDELARATCRRWGDRYAALAGCTGPDDVLARVPVAPDAVLGLLLARCAAGELLAGRVVLQALVPKVVRMAALNASAGVGDYLAALWCEIASYPLTRRPTSVAANLALDTLKAVGRERPPAPDVTTAPEIVLVRADRHPGRLLGAPTGRPGPTAVAVLERARARRLVDPATSDLLRSVYADGLSGAAAAEHHGLSPVAVRLRCSRALKVLARHADELADAC